MHGVPFSASPAGPKLDPTFWYPLPLADDPCHEPPPSLAMPEDYSASPEEGGSVVVVPDNAFNSFVPTGNYGFAEFVTDDATDRPSTVLELDLNQPCPSEFPDDIAGDVDDRPGRGMVEQCHQSVTPYTFI